MIREVSPELLIGDARDARDLRLLCDHRVEAVVDLALDELPAQLARDMIYCRIPILDSGGTPSALIDTAILCVITLVGNRIRTMVSCSGGMSRSPAVAAVALALLTKRSPNQCLAEITSGAPRDVSPLLWAQLTSSYDEIAASGE